MRQYLKTKNTMNANFSGSVYLEEIIYLLFNILRDCNLTVTKITLCNCN